jgi:dodecin
MRGACSKENSGFADIFPQSFDRRSSRPGRIAPVRKTALGKPVHTREDTMSVARVTEITASSTKSFDDAIGQGLARANKTLQGVTGAWVKSHEVVVNKGKITEYRVRMKITFVLTD